MEQRKKLRKMMNDPECLIRAVGAHNALGARIIEKIGFDAVWASGFEISASHAKPDANILTMTEFLYAASQMADSTHLPIIADCDTGFGDLKNVIRLVNEYEKAGISAICIEDKTFPKMNSFVSRNQQLIEKEEFAYKIIAAKNTQKDPDFVVMARIEALITGAGMQEALERAVVFREAGADMIVIHSKQKEAGEVLEFSSKWKYDTPLVIIPTTYEIPDMEQLRSKHKNIKMVIYANQMLRASVKAMKNILLKMKQSGKASEVAEDLSTLEEIFEIQGLKEMIDKENAYRTLKAVPKQITNF